MFRALLLEEADGKVAAKVTELSEEALPAGEVTVAVEYSTLNYKDGMILKGLGRLVRRYPHVPGVDFAGRVLRSEDPAWKEGDAVLLTGWRVGETQWGGYSQRARVKSGWLVKLPPGLSARHAMAIGTAGFTAMLAVIALEEHGMAPEQGEVLVTGAAGGVGSIATAILAKLGYRVAASTGRRETHDYLGALGASSIVDRSNISNLPAKPLESERWQACIDSVGGATLAHVLSELRYHGAVAACGLAGGTKLEATVLPFLLRGVNLLGIDSVMCPLPRRKAAWARLARDLAPERLERMIVTAKLSDLPRLAEEILAGRVRGRVVVEVNV